MLSTIISFLAFHATKNLCLAICQNRPCVMSSLSVSHPQFISYSCLFRTKVKLPFILLTFLATLNQIALQKCINSFGIPLLLSTIPFPSRYPPSYRCNCERNEKIVGWLIVNGRGKGSRVLSVVEKLEIIWIYEFTWP